MKRKIYPLLALLSLTFLCRAQEIRPNVVLIITDQHSGLVMNQQNYPGLSTPGIDKIAGQGVTFTRSYCAFPVCQSSRRSILTGMMASKCENVTAYPAIGKTLKNAGYETAYFGKWHVGGTDIDTDQGWHGFDTYEDGHDDTRISQASRDFIKQTHITPFFMVTSFQNPHDCCELARIISGVNENYHDGPVPHNMDLEFCPPLPDNYAIPPNETEGFYGRRDQDPGDKYWDAHPTKLWTTTEWRQYLYGYDRLVEKVDAHIEEVYDELASLGLLENTVIIYTSDHGDGHASHEWNQKKTFYEETINIPLVISWKGKTIADTIDKATLTQNGLDLYPTILQIAGIDIPESLHGESLMPNVLQDPTGETPVAREYIVSEIEQKVYTGNTPGTFVGRMLVTENMKYILFDRGVNREQLFDMENDPGELNPVTDDPAYTEQLISCRDMLREWTLSIDDDFNVDNIISQYEANAMLDGILINGSSLEGFSPENNDYTVDMEYTENVLIGATPVNSGSAVTISQASDIWGNEAARTATITAVSEDGSSTLNYTVILNVAEYVNPESTSTLSEITLNGNPINNFDPEMSAYAVTLSFADTVLIEATPSAPEADVSIIPPSDIWGDEHERTAIIFIVSKDGTSTSSYSIIIEINNVIFQTGFIDNPEDIPDPSWENKYGMMSTNIGDLDNHGLYLGDAAYKFVRGQEDKKGFLRTCLYERMDSLSFWMFIQNPESTAKLEIEAESEHGEEKQIATINADDLSASEWTQFAYEIAEEDAYRIIFTPTLPYDGDTRLWMDDLRITGIIPEADTASIVDTTDIVDTTYIDLRNIQASVYPNPASEFIHVKVPGQSIHSLTIYNMSGRAILSQKEVRHEEQIQIGSLLNGIYILRIETEDGNSTIKLIKN